MGIGALSLVAGGLQIAQGFSNAQQQKAMARSVQQQTEANIKNEQNALAIRKAQMAKEQTAFAAKQRVGAAGSGATLGSFDDLFSDTANQSLVDLALLDYDSKLRQENIRYGGAVESQQYKTQAKSSLLSGISKSVGSYSDYKSAQRTEKAYNAAKGL